MSSFRKGLILTAFPTVILSAIAWAGLLFEPLGAASIIGVVYCLLALVLSVTFYFGTRENRLAIGMFLGTCIGIIAISANIWWQFHNIGWTL